MGKTVRNTTDGGQKTATRGRKVTRAMKEKGLVAEPVETKIETIEVPEPVVEEVKVEETPKAAPKTETKTIKKQQPRLCGKPTDRISADQRQAAVDLLKMIHNMPGIKAGSDFSFVIRANHGVSSYTGLDGRTIKMNDKVILRKMENGARLAVYPVHMDTMANLVSLIERLPGCPTMESICPVCNKPLFEDTNKRFANLAGVARGLLLKQFSIETLQFRQRHDQCGKFDAEAEKLFAGYVGEVTNLQLQYKPGEAKNFAEGKKLQAKLSTQVAEKKKEFFAALANLAKKSGVGSEYVKEWYAQKSGKEA